jgi:hypothetical protein
MLPPDADRDEPRERESVVSLQGFTLADLEQYTAEGAYAPDESPTHHLFLVGRDDVHGVLTHLYSAVGSRMVMNMFGYDDDKLNELVMAALHNPNIFSLVTLDQSQAGSVHEKYILDSDIAQDGQAFNAHVVIGASATSQISDTKGAVLDGSVGFQGQMTSWSASGEGTFVVGLPGTRDRDRHLLLGDQVHEQTLMVFTDPETIREFDTELQEEHLAAAALGTVLSGMPALPPTPPAAAADT